MCTIMPGQRHLRTPMSVVSIVVRIYILQDDAGSGTFTLMSVVTIVVRIHILQDDAGSWKCTLNRPEAPPEGLGMQNPHTQFSSQYRLPVKWGLQNICRGPTAWPRSSEVALVST